MEAFSEEWFDELSKAGAATQDAALLWFSVLQPLVFAAGLFVYNNPEVLLVLAVLLLLLFLKRQIPKVTRAARRVTSKVRAKYDGAVGWVAAKSRFVAGLLPHVLLFVLAVFLSLFDEVTRYVVNDKALLLFGLFIPLVWTTITLLSGTILEKRRWLQYWIVLGFSYAVLQIPFLDQSLHYIPGWRIAQFFFVVWLWAVNGAGIACTIIQPVVSRYVARIPDTKEQQGMILRYLRLFGIISETTNNFLVDLLQDGTILLSLLFVFTPGFMTHYGCIITGIVYPVYSSLVALQRQRSVRIQKWLVYWVVFVVFTIAHEFLEKFLGWMPLWYDIELVIILWLQLPFFHGSSILFGKFFKLEPIQETTVPTPADNDTINNTTNNPTNNSDNEGEVPVEGDEAPHPPAAQRGWISRIFYREKTD